MEENLLITFMSKSFINKLFACLIIPIQTSIADGIKRSGSFSIEIHFAQVISVTEQLAFCVRYMVK